MKITARVKTIIYQLERELKTRAQNPLPNGVDHPGDFVYYWDSSARDRNGRKGKFVYPHMITLHMSMYEFASLYGGEYQTGANTSALVLPDVTIKWSRRDRPLRDHTSTETDSEFFDFVSSHMPDLAVHLAKSVKIGDLFTVQETIVPMYHVIHTFTNQERIPLYTELMRVVFALGLMDVHPQNWGWRRKKDGTIDFSTPVIFDVSKRKTPRSKSYFDDCNFNFLWDNSESMSEYPATIYDRLMEKIHDTINTASIPKRRLRKRNRKNNTPTGSIPSGWITSSPDLY